MLAHLLLINDGHSYVGDDDKETAARACEGVGGACPVKSCTSSFCFLYAANIPKVSNMAGARPPLARARASARYAAPAVIVCIGNCGVTVTVTVTVSVSWLCL